MTPMRMAWRTGAGLALAIMAAASPLTAQEPAATLIDRALESRARGSDQAAVVVFEISDFNCPHCARFAASIGPELDARYVETGQVQWVFVTLPLASNHRAWVSAKAALCAGATGDAFWAMRDRLFAEQRRWSRMDDPRELFARFAREAGAPGDAYDACVEQDRLAPLILQDFAAALSAGINGTPTFIVMRGDEVLDRILGVGTLEEWIRVLDEAAGH